uniref:Beta-defensin-like domain-containing protein n=1 Tax=Podarcis muralis TaxID=64176 RepID=A0A670I9Z4_PODMU
YLKLLLLFPSRADASTPSHEPQSDEECDKAKGKCMLEICYTGWTKIGTCPPHRKCCRPLVSPQNILGSLPPRHWLSWQVLHYNILLHAASVE